MTQKLYRVWLKGMTSIMPVSTAYGCPYVIAENTNDAIEKVQSYLGEKEIGFSSDRVLDKIELLAEEGDYPDCKIQLFL